MMAHQLIVVMGVSACGKSLIGERLAVALGVDFIEGDTLHSKENIAQMQAGIPLNDLQREPWLESIQQRLIQADRQHTSLVVSCSALKRRSSTNSP